MSTVQLAVWVTVVRCNSVTSTLCLSLIRWPFNCLLVRSLPVLHRKDKWGTTTECSKGQRSRRHATFHGTMHELQFRYIIIPTGIIVVERRAPSPTPQQHPVCSGLTTPGLPQQVVTSVSSVMVSMCPSLIHLCVVSCILEIFNHKKLCF